MVWTVRDTTERARLERAKSEFVATASHELRSPLTSIKGFVELLHRSPEGMSDRQREFVEIILKSTERLTELVNDLLDVARIEADRVEINRRPVDVGEAVREVAELMGPQIAAKRQRLSVHVAPDDRARARRPRRGSARSSPTCSPTRTCTRAREGGSTFASSPTARGSSWWCRTPASGWTAEQASRVFERFYRARDGQHALPERGSGCRSSSRSVELHDGQIEVESEPGRGSTFTVLLPAVVELGPDRAGRRCAGGAC